MFLLGHIGITIGLVYALVRYTSPGKRLPPVDYRLVLFGALLPDIIDKLTGFVILPEISNGRIFAHTLLFSLVFLAATALTRKAAVLFASLGVWVHQMLDRLWEDPRTLFWPFLGSFASYDWDIGVWWDILFTDPYTAGGEIVGSVIILALTVRLKLYRKENIILLLKEGRFPALSSQPGKDESTENPA